MNEGKTSFGGTKGTTPSPKGGPKLAEYVMTRFPNEPEMRAAVAKAYAVGNGPGQYPNDYEATSAIATDMDFTCVTSRESKSSAAAGYPTWRYLFNASYPAPGHAYHASELGYVFGTLRGRPTPVQVSLSRTMQSTWAKFAKDPLQGPGWDRVLTPKGKDLGHFTQEGKLVRDTSEYLDRHCSLFESYLNRRVRGS